MSETWQQTGGTQTGNGAPMAAAAAPVSLAPASWPPPDPIHLFAELIRDPFGGRGPLGSWFGDFSASEFQPRIDVTDEGDALRIVAELPGMTRDDVELEVIEDMLIICGDKRFKSTSEEQGCYRVERSFGHFQRAVPLPAGIDLDRAEARFENGVLTLILPKADEAQTLVVAEEVVKALRRQTAMLAEQGGGPCRVGITR